MLRIINLGLLLIVVVAAGVGYWGYKNFDEEATEGWSRDVRDSWYRYLDSREERIVLAPDDTSLANPYPDVETLTPMHDWFTHKIPSWDIALDEFKGKPNIAYLEVGAYEGRSVMWMHDNVLTHPTSRA